MPTGLLKLYMKMRKWDIEDLASMLQLLPGEVQSWLDGNEIPRCYGVLITLLGEEMLDPSTVALANDTIDAIVASDMPLVAEDFQD